MGCSKRMNIHYMANGSGGSVRSLNTYRHLERQRTGVVDRRVSQHSMRDSEATNECIQLPSAF